MKTFGIEIESNLAYKEVYSVKLPKGWMVVEEHCGSEIISPILSSHIGISDIKTAVDIMSDKFPNATFRNAGLHFHVGIADFTLGMTRRLYALCSRYEDIIFSFTNRARRLNKHCRPIEASRREIDEALTLGDLRKIQPSRNVGVNILDAYTKHGTVEFRYAKATFDWQKIRPLILLFLRLVRIAQSDMVIPDSDNANLNEEFEQFIGFFCPQKNARIH